MFEFKNIKLGKRHPVAQFGNDLAGTILSRGRKYRSCQKDGVVTSFLGP